MKRVGAAFLAMTLLAALLGSTAAAHHRDGLSPISPWHHKRGVEVVVGSTNDFGARWGACTKLLAQKAARSLDVVVEVDGVEVAPAGWSQPIKPSKSISSVSFP